MISNFPDPNLPPIVIVDDCEDDIFLLRYRLRAGGVRHPIRAFTSPAAAEEFLESAGAEAVTPALLFTDIKLQDTDGFGFITRLREHLHWCAMKIVVITSSTNPVDFERALALRVDGYLIKFPTEDMLADFVHHGPWFAVPRRSEALPHALSA